MSGAPIILHDSSQVRAACDDIRKKGSTVALVPTMGALHEGHLKLVDAAAAAGDLVVVSIFVNPTQFGPGEDLERYPRDLEGDVAKLAPRGAGLIFAPTADAMYPPESSTKVKVEGMTSGLCGATRPGHFEGVTTIVAKLFNIIGPCTAVFGRKDYQQLKVITQMARDLNLPVQIVGAPTVREIDGMAMSSRNAYLTTEDRVRARSISAGLAKAHDLYNAGERSVGTLRKSVLSTLEGAVDRIDYVTAAHPETLQPTDDNGRFEDRLLLALAVVVADTRLIDNTVLGEDNSPLNDSSNTEDP